MLCEEDLTLKGRSKLRNVVRKLAAIAALLALLLPGVSALAETLSAADLPACCNTIYCPLHHRQMSDLQRDKSNCDAMGSPGQNDCSMRACDAAPNPDRWNCRICSGNARCPSRSRRCGAAPALASRFFPYVATIPLTPPPRTFLS